MPTKSITELRDEVGESVVAIEDMAIEAGKVAEFARAVKDDNPAHRDEQAASAQGHGAVPAPLTFTRTAEFPRYRPDGVDSTMPIDLGFQPERTVHGEHEFTYERPVYVGDVLTGTVTLADVYQRDGDRGGTMTFAELEYEYYDQDDDLVLTETATIIETAAPIDEEGGR